MTKPPQMKKIVPPVRLTKQLRTELGRLLDDMDYLLAFIEPTTNLETLFVNGLKERVRFFISSCEVK